jgi:hypothetical protein
VVGGRPHTRERSQGRTAMTALTRQTVDRCAAWLGPLLADSHSSDVKRMNRGFGWEISSRRCLTPPAQSETILARAEGYTYTL